MTEKRFTEVYPNIIESSCSFRDNGIGITHKEVVELLNMLHEENQSLLEINKRCSDSHLRMRNRLERLQKDWDKLWDICKDKGMSEEELIQELER